MANKVHNSPFLLRNIDFIRIIEGSHTSVEAMERFGNSRHTFLRMHDALNGSGGLSASALPATMAIHAAGEYYAFSNREIAHAIKDGDPAAIRTAAKAMSQLLPKSDHRLLVPVPSHVGVATYTLRLAKALAQSGCGLVYNVLKWTEREPLYSLKQRGIYPAPEALGFFLQSPVPAGWEIAFVDNVVATGTTAAACLSLIGRGEMLVFAMDSAAYKG